MSERSTTELAQMVSGLLTAAQAVIADARALDQSCTDRAALRVLEKGASFRALIHRVRDVNQWMHEQAKALCAAEVAAAAANGHELAKIFPVEQTR